jgi:hypothetical protein
MPNKASPTNKAITGEPASPNHVEIAEASHPHGASNFEGCNFLQRIRCPSRWFLRNASNL